ncbi:hypothetical protein [Scytonema hofmannii]|nr:hypothetical protein [Scytonema hofmannii]
MIEFSNDNFPTSDSICSHFICSQVPSCLSESDVDSGVSQNRLSTIACLSDWVEYDRLSIGLG